MRTYNRKKPVLYSFYEFLIHRNQIYPLHENVTTNNGMNIYYVMKYAGMYNRVYIISLARGLQEWQSKGKTNEASPKPHLYHVDHHHADNIMYTTCSLAFSITKKTLKY